MRKQQQQAAQEKARRDEEEKHRYKQRKPDEYLEEYDEEIEEALGLLDDALDEDIATLENQQKGLHNSPSLQGQFSTLMEANVATFAQWYANKVI